MDSKLLLLRLTKLEWEICGLGEEGLISMEIR